MWALLMAVIAEPAVCAPRFAQPGDLPQVTQAVATKDPFR